MPDAQLRATLVGSQLIGLAMMRYIGHIEPLASATVDELVAALGPTVQRYLTGDLGARPGTRARPGEPAATRRSAQAPAQSRQTAAPSDEARAERRRGAQQLVGAGCS